jgi:hypothetical protein
MRPSSRLLLLAPMAVAVTTAACGPEDGPRKPVPSGYTGSVEFSRFTQFIPGEPVTEFLYAQAEFIYDADNLWLDAGRKVELIGPGGEVKLVRTQLPGKVVYQKEQGTDIDPSLFVSGATYSMDVAGSSRDYGLPGFELAGVLTLPQEFTLTAPDVSSGEIVIAAAATSLSLAWTPGDGEYVDVIIGVAEVGEPAVYLTYRVADDGAHTIPQVGLNTLPPGSGVLTVARKITSPLAFPEEGSGVGLGADAIQCVVTRQ